MTMLVVTHEMGFAAQVAENCFYGRGQIIEQNTPTDFLTTRDQNVPSYF